MNKYIFPFIILTTMLARAEDPVKIAVMDLKARQGVDKMVMMSLTDLVCTEISGFGGFEVIGRDDMQAMLEHIADQQLLECDDTKCLAQVGGALGVERLLSGNIGKVGDVYLINLKLIDIEDAKVLERFSKEFKGSESGLIQYVKHATNLVFGRPGMDAATLAKLEAEGHYDGTNAATAAPVMMASNSVPDQKKPTGFKKKILRYSLLGVGGVAAIIALKHRGDAESKYEAYQATVDPGEAETLRLEIEDIDQKATGTGALSLLFLLGGGLTFVF